MACPFILSTIHGSKGLEYDNVYLMDVQDGIFPEKVLTDTKNTDEESLNIYEEERRLFYVGTTRAKNNLYLFRTKDSSTFIKQLLYKESDAKKTDEVRPENPGETTAAQRFYGKKEKPFSQEQFQRFVNDLGEGVVVKHKKYGQGVVTAMDETNVTILFDDQEKVFNLRVLFSKQLLK